MELPTKTTTTKTPRSTAKGQEKEPFNTTEDDDATADELRSDGRYDDIKDDHRDKYNHDHHHEPATARPQHPHGPQAVTGNDANSSDDGIIREPSVVLSYEHDT